MLVNFTNHPSCAWSVAQLRAAREAYGSVRDLPFPAVDASADEAELCALAAEKAGEIISFQPDAVLCHGEFSLAFAVASALMNKGVPVICAASERRSVETAAADGSTRKESVFSFVRFRNYTFIDSVKEDETE